MRRRFWLITAGIAMPFAIVVAVCILRAAPAWATLPEGCTHSCPETPVCDGKDDIKGCYNCDTTASTYCDDQGVSKDWNPGGVKFRGSTDSGTESVTTVSNVCYRTQACTQVVKPGMRCWGFHPVGWACYIYTGQTCYDCTKGPWVNYPINHAKCTACTEE